MPYRCRRNGCRKFFSVKVGTVMQDSKLGYQEWAIAVYLFNTSLKGVSSMKLHRDLGISQKSAWHSAHTAMVYTDDHKAYSGLPRHQAVELTDEPGQRSNLSPEIVNVGL